MSLTNTRVVIATLSLTLAHTSWLAAQSDETRSNDVDPWFEKQRDEQLFQEKETKQDGEESETVKLRRASPRALARDAKKELAVTPDSNISRRINLLREIDATGQIDDTEKASLEELTRTRAAALDAISQANNPDQSIEYALKNLQPYATYLTRDPTLLVNLLESDFSDRLDQQIRRLGRQRKMGELEQLNDAIRANGFDSVFKSRLQISTNESLATAIVRKWEELSTDFKPLPGEAFLLDRALNQNETKLLLALELPANADPKLARNLSRSIEDRWGNSFEIVNPEARLAPPELILTIDSASVQSQRYSKEETFESIIPGRVDEEPNPEFLKLVEKYKKSAAAYEYAMQAYESQYRDYIDQMDDREYNQAQNDLKQAEQRLNSTPQFRTDGSPNPDHSAAKAEFQIAQGLANSVSPITIPEPVRPLPRHLDILDDLYIIPSTIVTSSEDTSYEYTSQNVEYTFLSESSVKLQTPVAPWVQSDTHVSLTQNRKWTKNLGVDPRDPLIDEGSYSESEYNSAIDLFTLEFGSRCAEKLEALIAEASVQINSNESPQASLEGILFTLALESSKSSAAPKLSDEELGDLARLAESPNVDPQTFRAECLARLLSKTRYKDYADPQRISQYL